MSTIEDILAGSERVKCHASKTKWKQLFFFFTHYIYIYIKINEVTTVCSLRFSHSLSKNVLDLLDKESTSGESSGRAILILEPVIFYFHQKTGK